MRFGLTFFPVMDPEEKPAHVYYDESLRLAALGDELDFDHVQLVEHYFSAYGGYSPDPVTFLSAVAARTRRIRVVTGAVVPAFTHPVKLAGKLAMLDQLSHGRLDVGFGRAFLPEEFAAFGVPMSESRARFAAGVETCRRLWSEQEVTVETPFWRFGPVTLLPPPYQRPHPPIFVAATTSAEACAAAGTAGYHLQVVPSVVSREALQEMLAAYRQARAAAGHHGPGRIQIKYTCYLAADRARAIALAREFELNYVAKMTSAVAAWGEQRSADYPGYEQLVEKVRRYDFDRALGNVTVLAGDAVAVTEQLTTIADWFGRDVTVSLQFNPGCLPEELATDAVRRFAAEVAPALPTDESVAGQPAAALAG